MILVQNNASSSGAVHFKNICVQIHCLSKTYLQAAYEMDRFNLFE